KALRTQALEEMYPIDKIQNQIKENRMEYEFGEITKEEYDEANKILMEKLRIAKKVKEMDLGVRVNILKAE
ncbi:MAG: protein gvpG, partial [Nanoarchaeota archaeon]|nr:protein gvpG [Nanoarchaeota archaeon]